MKKLLLLCLFFFGCQSAPTTPDATAVPAKAGPWYCNAINSGKSEKHGEGHAGDCAKSEACAQKRAIAACRKYHKKCYITFCTP